MSRTLHAPTGASFSGELTSHLAAIGRNLFLFIFSAQASARARILLRTAQERSSFRAVQLFTSLAHRAGKVFFPSSTALHFSCAPRRKGLLSEQYSSSLLLALATMQTESKWIPNKTLTFKAQRTPGNAGRGHSGKKRTPVSAGEATNAQTIKRDELNDANDENANASASSKSKKQPPRPKTRPPGAGAAHPNASQGWRARGRGE